MGRPKGSKNKPKLEVKKSLRDTLNDVLKNTVESFTGDSQESASVLLVKQRVQEEIKPYVTSVPEVEVTVHMNTVTASFIYDNTNFQYPQGV